MNVSNKMDTSSFRFYPALLFKQWCVQLMHVDCDVQTIVKKLIIHISAPQTFIPPSLFVVRENLDNNEFVDQGVVFRLAKCKRNITVRDGLICEPYHYNCCILEYYIYDQYVLLGLGNNLYPICNAYITCREIHENSIFTCVYK